MCPLVEVLMNNKMAEGGSRERKKQEQERHTGDTNCIIQSDLIIRSGTFTLL